MSIKELTSTYLQLVELHDAGIVADFIETLANPTRIDLRNELTAIGCRKLVRSLYYNYKLQEWI